MLWTLRWKRVLRLRNAQLGQFYVSTSRNMFPVNLNHLIKLFGLITWIIRRKYSKFSPSPPGWLAAPLFYCEDWWPLIFENKSCKIINKNVSHKFLLIRRRADTNYREKVMPTLLGLLSPIRVSHCTAFVTRADRDHQHHLLTRWCGLFPFACATMNQCPSMSKCSRLCLCTD